MTICQIGNSGLVSSLYLKLNWIVYGKTSLIWDRVFQIDRIVACFVKECLLLWLFFVLIDLKYIVNCAFLYFSMCWLQTPNSRNRHLQMRVSDSFVESLFVARRDFIRSSTSNASFLVEEFS